MMRNLSRSRVSYIGNGFFRIANFSFFLSIVTLTVTPSFAEQGNAGKPLMKKVTPEVQKLQMPFIANNGQVDERVLFYAQTFSGTVFVTKDGEIVYALPTSKSGESRDRMSEARSQKLEAGIPNADTGKRHKNLQTANSKSKTQNVNPQSEICNPQSEIRSVALKEQFVGAKVKAIQGEDPSVTKVNYFKDGDPEKWETDISTYDMVNLGEIYEGIDLRLKAYGNNVEKLFCVKSGADPDQIKISLSGVKDCGVQNAECGKNTPLSPLSIGDKSESQNLFPTPIGDPKLSVNTHGESDVGWVKRSAPTKQLLSVNERGELEVETELGPVKFTKPVAYQEINGSRVDVECKYTIADCGMQNEAGSRKQDAGSKKVEARSKKYALLNPKSEIDSPDTCHQTSSPATCHLSLTYGFTVASYDRTKELIIDPLLAATYLGGPYEDRGKSIAVDTDGNVFVAGETLSSEFPTTPGAYCPSRKGNTDVFVSKFNSGLTSLLASTFLGGSFNHERTYSIAIDAGGNIYVTGATYSTNFPTTRGAYDVASNKGWDVFVSKLNNGLTKLLASTFLGGNSDEYGYSIDIDSDGNVYVTGETLSPDFPTTPIAYDTSYNGGYYDAFVSKFDSGLTKLLASTFLGGGSGDYGRAIAIDAGGNAFVTGNTWSNDFPATPGAYNTTYNGGNDDVFVSKLNNGLTSLLASTFLGGSSNDYGNAIAADTGGNVYVAGETVSSNFPTTDSAYATAYNRGTKDVFVSKFNSKLTGLLTSTLLGGQSHDYGKAIAIDAGGNVYVAGSTSSTDFPTTSNAYDTTSNGGSDVFVSKFSSGLTNLLMSTFQGGSRSDYCNSIAVSAVGHVYVTGETLSLDFPATPGAYNTSYYRSEDVFVSGLNVDLSADKVGK